MNHMNRPDDADEEVDISLGPGNYTLFVRGEFISKGKEIISIESRLFQFRPDRRDW